MTVSFSKDVNLKTPDGDNAYDDSNDAVRVNVVAGAAAGGTSATDDAAFMSGASSFTPIGGFTGGADDEDLQGGKSGAARMTSARAIHAHIVNVVEVSVQNPVIAAQRTDALFDNVTALTPKFAPIDVSTSGANTIVSTVADKKIRVLNAKFIAVTSVGSRWEGGDGSALEGRVDTVNRGGYVMPFSPVGWFETSANQSLVLFIDADVSCGGSITYVEV